MNDRLNLRRGNGTKLTLTSGVISPLTGFPVPPEMAPVAPVEPNRNGTRKSTKSIAPPTRGGALATWESEGGRIAAG